MRLDGRPFAGASILAAIAVLTMLPAAAAEQEAGASPIQATLEYIRPFNYGGDPLLIRLGIFNTGARPYDNSAGINLFGGLKVTSASGTRLTMKGKAEIDPKVQPAVLAPGGFFGMIQDITPLLPDIAKAGTYTISWEGSGLSAPPVTVKVLPKFEPSEAYVAVIETDYGYLEFDLKSKEAPRHVQNFYDLALFGFYDNTPLFQVIKGVEVRGGDPSGTGFGGVGYNLSPEIATELKHRRGTLSSVKLGEQKQDSGSQFVITLSPHEPYDGALSIFGELRKGDDVLSAIENIPTSGQRDQPPHFRPLKPIVVRSVTVRKAAEPS
jgi:peptidyl-prolyl cis-trans isomerase B (cyclophilin B)